MVGQQERQRASAPTLIRTVLVANRGEIACRVMRTCRSMGIATVAAYSDADAGARHVREADEAVRIGESPVAASYLNIASIVQAALRTDADAVHPGYGFLSENAAFAAACRDAGLVFIGPSAEVIARMGSKREAKQVAAMSGVPVVPGYGGEDQSDDRFIAAAREVRYPVLVKASAGGGGKGMRTVEREADLPEALAAARREALSSFGDGTLLLEKLIAEPRHIEFQIFGDEHGNVIHLGERECSIQRRHQKIVEETPSTALTPGLRGRMGEAAVAIGRQLGYTNAGTVEFVLDSEGNFYFLEVNTRLQVEHPATELVTGLDLVRWQIEVAEGRPLPLSQQQIRHEGHAVEVRVYAEDPEAGFLPSTGPVALWREPCGEGVRVDAGIATGDVITPYYDPMLAKVVAHGARRDEALRRLDRALAATVLFGVRNNLALLRRVLLHPEHLAGRMSTAFLERHAADLMHSAPIVRDREETLPLAVALAAIGRFEASGGGLGWRNNPVRPRVERFVRADGEADAATVEARLAPVGGGEYIVTTIAEGSSSERRVRLHRADGGDGGDVVAVEVNGHRLRAAFARTGDGEWWVHVAEVTHALRWLAPLPVPATSSISTAGPAIEGANGHRGRGTSRRPGALTAPMPGLVVAVLAEAGREVVESEPVVVLEAMKMQQTIRAPHAGLVEAVHVAAGEQVAAGAALLDIRQPATAERGS